MSITINAMHTLTLQKLCVSSTMPMHYRKYYLSQMLDSSLWRNMDNLGIDVGPDRSTSHLDGSYWGKGGRVRIVARLQPGAIIHGCTRQSNTARTKIELQNDGNATKMN